MITSHSATLTVDGSGDVTAYAGSVIRGKVVMVKYVPGTLATGADLTVTGETTGVPILTKANAGTSTVWFFPKALASKNSDGANATDAFADLYVYKERIKIVVAQGGASKQGSIVFYVDEDIGL